MPVFRLLLLAMLTGIIVYTLIVGANHGYDLVPVFFQAIAEMGWPGQFNVDFSCFLILSGVWIAWRHNFSAAGLLLAPVAIFGGMLFLSAYLLIASLQVKGDVVALLLGKSRALAVRG